jgi:hypothetical protein
MMRALRGFLRILLLAAPAAGAAAWSCRPAAMALYAAYTIPVVSLTKGEWTDPARILELRRQLQQHLLAHDTYVPLEDIVAAPREGAGNDTALLMQKACGRGRLFIWIPFKFKLPVTGEKVVEWCWKPQTKDV